MKLIFASHNKNKTNEIISKLGDQYNIEDLSSTSIQEIEENGKTLEENALIKARYVYAKIGKNCFADDTGLEVEALGGEPGVFSARYAGMEKSSEKNMNKLLDNLKSHQNRTARFRTVIALIIDGKEYLFEGVVNGSIIEEKKGNMGFGYDPIFIPDGYEKSFAELSLEIKNKISHRAIAIEKLVLFLREK